VTVLEAAKEEAAKFGRVLTDDEAEYVIWEHTGFPAFWNIPDDGATPEECFRDCYRLTPWGAPPADETHGRGR